MTWKVGLRLVDLSELAKQMYCKFCRAILDLNRIGEEKQVGFACEWTIHCHCGKRNEVHTTPPAQLSGFGQHAFTVNIKAAMSIKKHCIPVQTLCCFFQDLTVPFGLDHDHQQCVLQYVADVPSSPQASHLLHRQPNKAELNSEEDNDDGSTRVYLQATGESDPSDSEILETPDIKLEVVDEPSLSHPIPGSSLSRICQDEPTPKRNMRQRNVKTTATASSETTNVPNASITSDAWFHCTPCNIYFAKFTSLYSHQIKKHGLDYAQEQKALIVSSKKTAVQGSETSETKGAGKGRARGKRKSTNPTKKGPRSSARLSQGGITKSKRGKDHGVWDDQASAVSDPPMLVSGKEDADNLPVTFAGAPVRLNKAVRRYSCSMCGKEFATQRSQKHHERVHLGELPYGCGKCSLKFRATHQLIHHIRVEHSNVIGSLNPRPSKVQASARVKATKTKAKMGLQMTLRTGVDIEKLKGEDSGDRIQGDTEGQETPDAAGSLLKEGDDADLKMESENMPGSADPAKAQCSVCLALFPSSRSLTNHMRMHTEGLDIYKCTRCAKSFRFRKDLIGHSLADHNVEFNFACSTCGKCFRNYGTLYNHKFTHSEVKKFQCGTCGMLYSRRGTLSRHEQRHKKDHAYKCGICNKVYHFLQNLRQHMMTHKEHQSFKNVGPFICHKCGKTYSCSSSLYVHLMTHRMELSSKYVDSFMAVESSSLLASAPHMTSNPVLKFLCPDCGEAFRVKSVYYEHIRIAHGKGKRLVKCPFCPREFCRVSYFEDHVNKHLNRKLFQCEICDKKFTNQRNLKRHVDSFHSECVMPSVCNTCGKAFTTQRYLRQHERIHGPDAERYKCSRCHKLFRYQTSLRKHTKGCKGK